MNLKKPKLYYRLVFLLLLLPITGYSQGIIERLDSVYHLPWDSGGAPICPWSSWKIESCSHVAIQVVVDEENKEAFLEDGWMISEALWEIFHEKPLINLELVRRDYRVFVHRPGNYFPMDLRYRLLDTGYWVDFGKFHPNPDQGWRRMETQNMPGLYIGGFALAEYYVGNGLWAISAAIFMK